MGKLKLIILLLIPIVMMGCCLDNNNQRNVQSEKLNTNDLKQDSSDLLHGAVQAVCYSGFRTGQHPDRGEGSVNPNYEQIAEDLSLLISDGNFHLIRMYDSGLNSGMVLQVIRDMHMNIKVMLGIWLKAEISNHTGCSWLTEPIPDSVLNKNKSDNLYEIRKGIQLANDFEDVVIAMNVGNEALVSWNDHMVKTDTVIAYVNYVKKHVRQPVTVADNYKWWVLHGKDLAEAVDFISIHTYPIWEGQDIDEAMNYTVANVREVRHALPEARLVISEAGWATVASEFGKRASEEKQKRYYNELMTWAKAMNITIFWFEAFDEDWKGSPDKPMGAEKHWGLFTIDRKPKLVMHKP